MSLHFFRHYLSSFSSWIRIQEGKLMKINEGAAKMATPHWFQIFPNADCWHQEAAWGFQRSWPHSSWPWPSSWPTGSSWATPSYSCLTRQLMTLLKQLSRRRQPPDQQVVSLLFFLFMLYLSLYL